ncbi:MAG: hypothetical protein L6406_14765 [Desulfobacterales bacterium]|nr:hypothetical protein [Desulfobacterales bacterium]
MKKKAMEFNKKLRESGREIPVPTFPKNKDVRGYQVKDILFWTQDLLRSLDFIEPEFSEAFDMTIDTMFDNDPQQKVLLAKIPMGHRRQWA